MFKWTNDNRVAIDKPKRPKKVTGTRFATILGYNVWSTPFEVWCEITKTYAKPFEDTIYTKAGKAIEPLQIEYMKKSYGMTNLVTPTDVYGENYFNKTFGDFYPDDKIFGGMWDSLLVEDGKPTTVLEFKTTKRSEDWKNGVPIYYGLQASLYAYLLGIDDVIMIVSFLNENDYENPESFKPSAENTATIEFKVSEQYPEFPTMVKTIEKWHRTHVDGGISPEFDEKKDAEILSALRKNVLPQTTDFEKIISRAEVLRQQIDKAKAELSDTEKEYDALTKAIKDKLYSNIREGDTKVEYGGTHYTWTLSKSKSTEIDKASLESDGLLDKYSKSKETIRLNVKRKDN